MRDIITVCFVLMYFRTLSVAFFVHWKYSIHFFVTLTSEETKQTKKLMAVQIHLLLYKRYRKISTILTNFCHHTIQTIIAPCLNPYVGQKLIFSVAAVVVFGVLCRYDGRFMAWLKLCEMQLQHIIKPVLTFSIQVSTHHKWIPQVAWLSGMQRKRYEVHARNLLLNPSGFYCKPLTQCQLLQQKSSLKVPEKRNHIVSTNTKKYYYIEENRLLSDREDVTKTISQ